MILTTLPTMAVAQRPYVETGFPETARTATGPRPVRNVTPLRLTPDNFRKLPHEASSTRELALPITITDMANLFTSVYFDELQRRWLETPPHGRPLIARIALDDHRQDDRERIERFIERLHPDDAPRMASLLRSQFEATYGELIVAQVMINAGFSPRYEPSVRWAGGVLTPDWFIGGCAPWVCDAFTAGLTDDRNAHETALREIEARLTGIAAPYTVRLEIADAAGLDSRLRKQFALKAQRWLDTRPSVGDSIVIGDARIEVAVAGGTHVDVMTIEPMHIVVTPSSLAKNFEAKAKRYAPLNLPVVAAAVVHFRAEIDTVDVEDVLFGTLAYVSGENSTGKIVGRTQRLNDGVFAKRPDLSGAIWINPYRLTQPVVRFWSNPAARWQLPTDSLKRLAVASL